MRFWGKARPGGKSSEVERGSAMMLVPAGFLVLILFAAIAVDSATAYLGQQQLKDALSTAAADAATAGLSAPAFYGSGVVAVSPAEAATVACASVDAQANGDLHAIRLAMAVAGTAVELRATAEVPVVFGRIVPGFGVRQVTADAVADAEQAPSAAPPALPAPVAISCGDASAGASPATPASPPGAGRRHQ